MQIDNITLTVDETAARLRLSRNSTYAAIRRGELPAVHVGRRILVPAQALERWLEEAGRLSVGAN